MDGVCTIKPLISLHDYGRLSVETYFCAPISTRIVARRRWKLLPLVLFLLWLYVNGVYWAHWSWQNPEGLAQMREANAFASTFLYLLCGMIWLHHDPLYEVLVQR